MPQSRRKPASDPTPADPGPEPDALNADPPPVPEQPPEPEPMPEAADRQSRTGRLVRLGVVLLVVAAIAVASFVGWPILYSRYIAPIGANSADLDEVRDRLDALDGRLEELAADDAAIGDRVSGLDDRLARIEDAVSEHTARLAELDAMDAQLAADTSDARSEVAREVSLLKAMELMSRARLFLYESNFGLAEEDLAAARELLAGLDEGTASTSMEAIRAAIDRLDRTLDALPDFPVVASDDLDIAWQAMLGKTPPPSLEPTPPPEPSAEASAEPSASASP